MMSQSQCIDSAGDGDEVGLHKALIVTYPEASNDGPSEGCEGIQI